MVMRKATLRRLSPVARKVARIAGEADSIGRRLKNMTAELQQLETDLGGAVNEAKHFRDVSETQRRMIDYLVDAKIPGLETAIEIYHRRELDLEPALVGPVPGYQEDPRD